MNHLTTTTPSVPAQRTAHPDEMAHPQPIRPVKRHRTPVDHAVSLVHFPARKGQVARVHWGPHWYTAHLQIYTGSTGKRRLTYRQELQALRWATEVLLANLGTDDGYHDQGAAILTADELVSAADHCPDAVDLDGLVECVDCHYLFHPDSSPHLDRCWACAERWDHEHGNGVL